MRNSGRTTKQLLNMMQGDVFVAINYNHIDYCKKLVQDVIRVHPSSIKWISVGDIIHGDKAMAFLRSASFHIDHAVSEYLFRLPSSQRDKYFGMMAKLSERHKIISWESMHEQGKQDA